jgi:lipopolysaccharide transport system ATP-binding protein
LEVGTGFHPEMTGRENIYLNGAIMGMTKREISSKFDEIVDFAGVERYVDTPVKRYSSGMYVRLAFAVAAHLEPEILIVDEVLAVGDAEFQKKCLGKMKDVSVNDGRTVLFVSHNMAAVKQLCTTGIVMRNGAVVYDGAASSAVDYYQTSHDTDSFFEHEGNLESAPGNGNIKIFKFEVRPLKGEVISISTGFEFILDFYNASEDKNLAITFELRNLDEIIVFHHGHWVCENNSSQKGKYSIKATINPNILNAGIYKFSMIFAENQQNIFYKTVDFVQFEILNEVLAGNSQTLPGITRPDLNYQVEYIGM